VAILWSLRLGLPLATAFAIRAAVRHRPEPDFKRRLEQVRPFEGWRCPLCGGQLINLPRWHCLSCGAEHRPLAAANRVAAI
jgi:rubrerythrin